MKNNGSQEIWHPIKDKIVTRWVQDVSPKNPLPEYPRPQLRRNEWINLNGLWDYAIRPKKDNEIPKSFDGKILVPFPIESALSGVKKRLTPKNKLWYRRFFTIPESWNGYYTTKYYPNAPVFEGIGKYLINLDKWKKDWRP